MSSLAADPPAPPPALTPLHVLLKGRCVKFSVETAESSVALQQGLMMRRTLPAEQGMLFVFPEEKQWSMWMENTLIDLDMIFIDTRGVIKKIQHQATSKSLAIRRPDVPVKFVLEISGGLAQKMDLQVGDSIFHNRIGNTPPALCQTAQTVLQIVPPPPVQVIPSPLPTQKQVKGK